MTYKVSLFCFARLEAIFKSRVDFPTPGLPPISVSEPGTIPPPSTRSNSSSLDEKRSTSVSTMSVIGFAFAEPVDVEVSFTTSCSWALSSTNESQVPHPVHFPIHLGEVNPQCWHSNNTLFFLAMVESFIKVV